LDSPQTQGLPPLEEVEPHSPSPDMRPVELPPGQSPSLFFLTIVFTRHCIISVHDVPFEFPRPDTMQETPLSPSITHQEATVSRIGMTSGEPVTYTTSRQSSRSSSLFLPPSDGSFEDEDSIVMEDYDGYDSPLIDERIAEMRNERRYRYLLTHEYNPSRESVHQWNDVSPHYFSGSHITPMGPIPRRPRRSRIPLQASRPIHHTLQCLHPPEVG